MVNKSYEYPINFIIHACGYCPPLLKHQENYITKALNDGLMDKLKAMIHNSIKDTDKYERHMYAFERYYHDRVIMKHIAKEENVSDTTINNRLKRIDRIFRYHYWELLPRKNFEWFKKNYEEAYNVLYAFGAREFNDIIYIYPDELLRLVGISSREVLSILIERCGRYTDKYWPGWWDDKEEAVLRYGGIYSASDEDVLEVFTHFNLEDMKIFN